MKLQKFILLAALSLVTVMGVVGCGSGVEKDPEGNAPTPAPGMGSSAQGDPRTP